MTLGGIVIAMEFARWPFECFLEDQEKYVYLFSYFITVLHLCFWLPDLQGCMIHVKSCLQESVIFWHSLETFTFSPKEIIYWIMLMLVYHSDYLTSPFHSIPCWLCVYKPCYLPAIPVSSTFHPLSTSTSAASNLSITNYNSTATTSPPTPSSLTSILEV